MAKRDEKITSRDVPRLLHELAEGDAGAQAETLRLLCPCRNRCYNREVWLSIFRCYEEAQADGLGDAAAHAIGTLVERARTDPRTQDLLRWIAGQGVTSLELGEAVPTWNPRPHFVRGLPIPPRERTRRSRANRRR